MVTVFQQNIKNFIYPFLFPIFNPAFLFRLNYSSTHIHFNNVGLWFV